MEAHLGPQRMGQVSRDWPLEKRSNRNKKITLPDVNRTATFEPSRTMSFTLDDFPEKRLYQRSRLTAGRIASTSLDLAPISFDLRRRGSNVPDIDRNNEDTAKVERRLPHLMLKNGPSSLGSRSLIGDSVSQSQSAPPGGLVGLHNLGNTCFMNSCLQCLCNTSELVDWFLKGSHLTCLASSSPLQGELAGAYSDLVKGVWNSAAYTSLSPALLKRIVSKWAPHFSGYAQHDSQEFMRFLLDGLCEDLNRTSSSRREAKESSNEELKCESASTNKSESKQAGGRSTEVGSEEGKAEAKTQGVDEAPVLSEAKLEELSEGEQAAHSWRSFLRLNDSFIADLFCGQLQSTVECLSCHRTSACFDPFYDLSLPIPEGASSQVTDTTAPPSSPKVPTPTSSKLASWQWRGSGSNLFLRMGGSSRPNSGGSSRPGSRPGSGGGSRAGSRPGSESGAGAGPGSAAGSGSRLNSSRPQRAGLGGGGQSSEGGGRSVCALEDCLRVFTEVEVLENDNKYFCKHCRKRRRCHKRLTVRRFPQVLVLHLKRFTYTEYCRDKLTTTVHFPVLHLDMSEFSSGTDACGGRPVYDLYAVSNHIGGLGGGHYNANCLNREDNEWYTFNDSVVSQTSVDALDGSRAYVLFYKKRC